jgi:formamidopyrimidine-DNA glycosylase
VPELPEVEMARRLAARVATGRRIVAVRAARDPLVLDGATPGELRRALVGRRIVAARRHGKHLWLELDRRPWPCFHFGMTGGLHAPATPGVRLRSGQRAPAPAWPPRFVRLRLALDDGGELAFADARRLGRVRLRDVPRRDLGDLGFDALRGIPPPGPFLAALGRRRTPVKALLLDQAFAAGVGNWIADEVLYQAGIDPRRPAAALAPSEGRRLRAALRRVVATAVRLRADEARYPRPWLFHVRWGRDPRAVTARGERVRHLTVGGRTTAWVPARQR